MRILRFLGGLLILMASPAMAKDSAAWIVTQKSGDVRVLKNGLQPASVQVRAALSAGDVVATGANGRAMLTRGDDYVVVAPGSRLLLPKEQKQSGFTRLVQQVGTMLYKVKHTGVPHFAVETPMLAAVVKGTSFTVVVDKDRAAVQVTEGVVEVSSISGDARRLVEGGVTVYVGRERPQDIIELKPGAAPLPSSSGGDDTAVKIDGSGDVSLGTITDLTGGLVREAPTAPVVEVATARVSNVVAATAAPATGSAVSAVTDVVSPVADVAEAVVPIQTDPLVAILDTTVPAVTDPVVGIVEAVVTPVTQPVVGIVGAVVTPVTQPVVGIVEAVVTPVTQPVVGIVQAVVTPVTQPVVGIVATVTQPAVGIVETVVPTVAQPVVGIVETVVPTVTQPVIGIVETVVPTITQPVSGVLGGLLGGGNSGPGGGGSSGSNSGPGSGGLLGGLFGGGNSGSGGGGNSGPGGGGGG